MIEFSQKHWKAILSVVSLLAVIAAMSLASRDTTPVPPKRMQPLQPLKAHRFQVGRVGSATVPSVTVGDEMRIESDSSFVLRGAAVLGDQFKLSLTEEEREVEMNTGGWPKEPRLEGLKADGGPRWRPAGAPVRMLSFYKFGGMCGKPLLAEGRMQLAAAGCDVESRTLTFESGCRVPKVPGRYEPLNLPTSLFIAV